jgi:predicted ATPase
VRAQLKTARELGEQLLSLAQHRQDRTLLLEAHSALGQTLCILGELAPALTHLEQAITLYDPQQHHSLAFRYGYDPGVYGRSLAAWVLWLLGYPGQALQRGHEALTLARELPHPFSLALALIMVAALHQMCRQGQAAQERAEASLTLSTEQGFPYLRAIGTILWGWALAAQERGEEGLAQMRQGLVAWRATEAEITRTYLLALLAEGYGKVGQAEEGLRVLAEALVAFETSGRGDLLAEAYRLQGTFLLRQTMPDIAQAEACFQQALAIARRQQAKSWELRAATSLARLWQQQGKCTAAYDLLAPVYGWFTEGFDTADLQEAKALLEDLGA